MSSPLPTALSARFSRWIAEGLSGRTAVTQLKLSAATGVHWQRKLRQTSAIVPQPQGRPRGLRKLAPHQTFLEVKVTHR